MSEQARLEELLARHVACRVRGETPPEARALCRNEPELLESLRELIAEYEGLAHDMVDPEAASQLAAALVSRRPARRTTAAGTTRERSPGLPFAAGRMLAGRYRVGRLLGRGGLGEVWSARDVKLGVDVALKSVLGERIADPRFRELVRHEVRSAREVHSPNVCRIYDLVEADGQELVSMELVDGQTLREVLRERGPLELEEAADVASQLLAGLEAVHAAGLVHRDVKPENVMLTRTGRVVVMDLGLAKPAAEAGGSTIVGTPAYMAPEQAVGSGVDARADVYAAGIVLAELVHPEGVAEESSHQSLLEGVRKEPPEVAATPWAEVVRKAVARSPEERYATARALARELERVTLGARSAGEASPYPGLSSFTETEAEYFFGREVEVEGLWKKLLRPPRLLAVVGPSGAGKSSFLRAGAVASRPEGWAAMVVTPGATPFVALGQAVARELVNDRAAGEQLVRFAEPDVAVEILARWRRTAEHALLVVDQFEELFTQSPPEAQQAFAELLGRLPLEADLHVALGMRDDFLLACHDHEPLAPVFSELTPLQAPSGAALRRALMQPALKCGYRFEDEALVEEMLEEVAGERGALPLLAFAAAALWERRDRESGLLGREAYVAIGGVGGALARHAEETLERIGASRQGMVRELFRNLITRQGTRASRSYETLLSVFEDREGASEVLAALIDARLLTSFETAAAEGEAPEHRVEIVHESLLAAWPRLVRWQTQDADAAQMREQVRDAARLWAERGRPEELLWSGPAYRELVVWSERYPGRLTAVEQAFAEATRELAGRRRRRRRWAVALLVASLAAVALSLGWFWRRAERQALRAEASKLLALGRLELDSDPTAALAYAIASLELADDMPARRFALEALWRGPTRFRLEGGDRLSGARFSPDGRWLVAGLVDGRLLLWSRAGGRPRPLGSHAAPIGGLAFTRTSDRLVSYSPTDEVLRLWSVPDGDLLWEWRRVTFPQHQRLRGTDLAFFTAPEGQSGPRERHLEIWSLEGPQPTRQQVFPLASDVVERDSSLLVRVEGPDRRILRLYRLDDPQAAAQTIGSHPAPIVAHAIRPDGKALASADEKGDIRLWSLTPGRREPERTFRVERIDRGDFFQFDRSGSKLVHANPSGGDIHVWSLLSDRAEPDWTFHSGERGYRGSGLTFNHPLSMLATMGLDMVIRLYRLEGPPEAEPLVLSQGVGGIEATGLSFHPDGRWLGSTDYGGLSLWPLGRPYPYVPISVSRSPWFGVALAQDGTWVAAGGLQGIWLRPLSAGGPSWNRTMPREGVTKLAPHPDGRSFVAAGQGGKVYLETAGDGESRILEGFANQVWGIAVSPDGRLVAAGGGQSDAEERFTRVWNLETGASQVLRADVEAWVTALRFLPDGSLLEANPSGLRRWDLETGSFETLREWDWTMGFVAASRDGRRMLSYGVDMESPVQGDELQVEDLESGSVHTISSHGRSVFAAAFDPTGTVVVTGDLDGVVRAGPVSGAEPHLLFGHEQEIMDVATTSDGKWIASTGYDGSVRLWPMPDVTEPPLHTLPHDELLAKLRSLTNLRVVPDQESATGYRLEAGPFPGWETLPSW